MERVPDFHDGYLTGISLERECAELAISLENGEKWRVTIHGVQALHVDEFREGNVINRFDAVCRSTPARDILQRLFYPPHPSAAREFHEQHAALLKNKSEMVTAGQAVLIVITPSYGAELLAFGERYEAIPIR